MKALTFLMGPNQLPLTSWTTDSCFLYWWKSKIRQRVWIHSASRSGENKILLLFFNFLNYLTTDLSKTKSHNCSFYHFPPSCCFSYSIILYSAICQPFFFSEHISSLPSCLKSLWTPNANLVRHLIRHINSISPLIALIPLCNEFLCGILGSAAFQTVVLTKVCKSVSFKQQIIMLLQWIFCRDNMLRTMLHAVVCDVSHFSLSLQPCYVLHHSKTLQMKLFCYNRQTSSCTGFWIADKKIWQYDIIPSDTIFQASLVVSRRDDQLY